MHTHAHSWIYCHSVRLARTASMGEILMGTFLSEHALNFFVVVFAFTLQTAEEVAPDRMDLGGLLVLRIWKQSPFSWLFLKGRTRAEAGSGSTSLEMVRKAMVQGLAQARRKYDWTTKNGPGHPNHMFKASSVYTPTALCISAPVYLTSSSKGEVLSQPLLQGLLEMSHGYCHKCSGPFRPGCGALPSQLSPLPSWSFQLLWVLLMLPFQCCYPFFQTE